MRRDVERWIGAVISLVSAYMLYKAVSSIVLLSFPDQGHGPMFWLQPVAMFVGGAAVWRMGSVLRERSFPEKSQRAGRRWRISKPVLTLVFENRPVADLSLADPRQCCV